MNLFKAAEFKMNDTLMWFYNPQELLNIIESYKLELIALIAIIIGICTTYLIYHTREYYSNKKCDSHTPLVDYKSHVKKIKSVNVTSLSAPKYESFPRLEDILHQLHDATDKCYDTGYAAKCIRLTAEFPYLINVKNGHLGLTPFHRVCLRGHTCLIEFMLAKGADPYLKVPTGEDALSMAIYYCVNNPGDANLSHLNLLYNAGCRLDPCKSWYKNMLKTAIMNQRTNLSQWMLTHSQPLKHNSIERSYSTLQ